MTVRRVGRYQLFDAIAAGGMGAVHIGRLVGDAGFVKPVAIKRMHAHHAIDQELVMMFLDEAKVTSRIRHPNVVPLLDVISVDDDLLLVMDFVVGATLAQLVAAARRAGERLDRDIVSAVISDALLGLHAAHEARSEKGEPLDIVHRDVSPQNIMVGGDGVTRVLDFGIATAARRLRSTSERVIRGKPEYLAPEQITGGEVDRRADVFAMGVVLWEVLTGERLFGGGTPTEALHRVLEAPIRPPSELVSTVPPSFDAVCMRALEREPAARFASAEAMARALLRASLGASSLDVADAMKRLVGDLIAERRRLVSEVEARADQDGHEAAALDEAITTPLTTTEGRTRHDLAAEITAADESGSRRSVRAEPAETRTTLTLNRSGAAGATQGFGRRTSVLALVLVVAGGLTALALLRRDPAAAPAVSSADAPAPGIEASRLDPSASAPVETAAPAETASAQAAESVRSAAASAPPPRPPAPAAGVPARPAKADCDPPYWIDEHGDRRFKPHCF